MIPRRRRWDRHKVEWFDANALRLHAALLVGVTGCAVASWIEWTRALTGHEIAWVYAFEWPLFAVMGSYLWWKLLHADADADADADATSHPPATDARRIDDDPGLAAWEDYLLRLHAADPPGGPPER